MRKTVGIILLCGIVSHPVTGFGDGIIDGIRDAVPWPMDREEYRPEYKAHRPDTQLEDRFNSKLNQEGPLKERTSAGIVPMTVKGVAVAVIPNAESLTVADSVTGDHRMFRVHKNQLLGIQPGQKIIVTPQDNDPHMAKRVESDPLPLY